MTKNVADTRVRTTKKADYTLDVALPRNVYEITAYDELIVETD